MTIAARDRLIVALDLPSTEAARGMISKLGDAVSFYKIGYQLGFAGGLEFARELIGQGKQVFVDLKLHDIPTTVAAATEACRDVGAAYLSVHTGGGAAMLESAVRAAQGRVQIVDDPAPDVEGLRLVGVEVDGGPDRPHPRRPAGDRARGQGKAPGRGLVALRPRAA